MQSVKWPSHYLIRTIVVVFVHVIQTTQRVTRFKDKN